ncbi:hypothetical protein LJC27_02460 [Christensenellaceae bacterium OttesenSCG-928-M15]|nr:hypothetical protein [Christensenellaceae bacterium OttesenSCG-928-M15]
MKKRILAIVMIAALVLAAYGCAPASSGEPDAQMQAQLDALQKEKMDLEQKVSQLEAQDVGAGAAEPVQVDVDQLVNDWLYDKDNYASGVSTGFLPGAENAPTDEELVRMLEIAGNHTTVHGLSGAHFIVIRDPAEQEELVGHTVDDCSGTVLVLVLADGLRDEEHHLTPYTARDADWDAVHYWRMHYGITEASMGTAYLKLAAAAMGYRTHEYGALNLVNADLGYTDLYSVGGSFDHIGTEGWDYSKYAAPKDGGEAFAHYFAFGDTDVPVLGNLQLLYGMVIGKVDESDVTTTTSTKYHIRGTDVTRYRYNYDFWDPQN